MSRVIWRCPDCGQEDTSRAGKCWDCGQETKLFDSATGEFVSRAEAEALLASEAMRAKLQAWFERLSEAGRWAKGHTALARDAAILLVVIVVGLLIAGPAVRVLRDYSFMRKVSRALEQGEVFSPKGRCAVDIYGAERRRHLASSTLARASGLIRGHILPPADAALSKYLKDSEPSPDWTALARTYGFLRDAYPAFKDYAAKYWYCMGQASLESRQYGDARRDLMESLRFSPDWSPALNGLGRVYIRADSPLKDDDLGLDFYRRAEKADPANPWPARNIGEYYAGRRDYSQAEKYYARALAAGSAQPAILRRAGDMAMKVGKVDEGLRDYKTALQYERDPATSHELAALVAETNRRMKTQEPSLSTASARAVAAVAEAPGPSSSQAHDGNTVSQSEGGGASGVIPKTAGSSGQMLSPSSDTVPAEDSSSDRQVYREAQEPPGVAGRVRASGGGVGGQAASQPGPAALPPRGDSPGIAASPAFSPPPSTGRPWGSTSFEPPLVTPAVPFSLVLRSSVPIRTASAAIDGKAVSRSRGPGSRGVSYLWVGSAEPGPHSISISVYPLYASGRSMEAHITFMPQRRPVFVVDFSRGGRFTMRQQGN